MQPWVLRWFAQALLFGFCGATACGASAIASREPADGHSGKMMAWADGSPIRVVQRSPAGRKILLGNGQWIP